MIGLDTNILVRYFTQDDPAQANDLIERRISEQEPGFVSVVVVAELVWVLQRTYRFGREKIAAAIERMLQVETLIVQNEREVFTALVAMRDGWGEFADALIGALSASAGCSRVVSFDQGTLQLPGFELP